MRYGTPWGFYELNKFPGCNQIAVSNHAFIRPEFRGQGKGQETHQARLDEARKLGYDSLVCTVRASNIVQIHILKKYGWTKVNSFRNRETGNEVEMWVKNL